MSAGMLKRTLSSNHAECEDGSIGTKQECEQTRQWFRCSASVRATLLYVSLIIVYFTGIIVIYSQLEGWSHIDCIYFAIAVMTTVGYGDYVPTTDKTKMATIFVAHFALIVAAFAIAYMATVVHDAFMDKMRLNSTDVGIFDESTARRRRRIASLLSMLLYIFMVFLGAIVFATTKDWEEAEGNPWVGGVYLTVITLTTVGFGDFSPDDTDHLKLFGCFLMIVGIPVAASALALLAQMVFGEVGVDLSLRSLRTIKNGLTKEKFAGVICFVNELRSHGIGNYRGQGANKVSRFEYLCFVLVENVVIEVRNIRNVMKSFDDIDTSKDGFIDFDDILLRQSCSIMSAGTLKRPFLSNHAESEDSSKETGQACKQTRQWFRCSDSVRATLLCVSLIILYFIGNIVIYSQLEGWSYIDCIYFAIVVVTTVGYGDYVPTTIKTKMATIFVAHFALIVAAFAIAYMVTVVHNAFMNQMRLNSTDVGIFEARRRRRIASLLSMLLYIFIVFLGAIVFATFKDWEEAEGNPWVDGVYLTVITLTTVGFGDFSPDDTDHLKLFGCFLMVVGIPVAASALALLTQMVLGEVGIDLSLRTIKNGLTKEKLDGVIDFVHELRSHGIGNYRGQGANKVSRFEYLCFVLVQNGVIEGRNIRNVMKSFDDIDTSKDGFIDFDDIDTNNDGLAHLEKGVRQSDSTALAIDDKVEH